MEQPLVYTEAEVKAIVAVERAEARYQAMHELLATALNWEQRATKNYFKTVNENS